MTPTRQLSNRTGPATASGQRPAASGQRSLADLGLALREVAFLVVDVETTGTAAQTAEITEIAAVKVRGGQVVGEFATLVRPRRPIPPLISVLTGITDAMVATSPPVGAVLPALFELARGCVLVAHNAAFDVSFLRTACERTGREWPAPPVLDTLRLARRVLGRDETPNFTLASLAALFSTTTQPCHRALADARATVDVLHGLLARAGSMGALTWEDLRELLAELPPAVRRQRHLAAGLPAGPGVYVFRGPREEPLYVGRSRDIAARVRSYFTASETRHRIREMVVRAARVEAVSCATELEAAVRELRLIAAHRPPYNRRSRDPQRLPYLKVTREPFPRLALVRARTDPAATYLGPFPSRVLAEAAREALQEVFPLRRCTTPLRPGRTSAACALAELGRCAAPCEARISPADYAATAVSGLLTAITADPTAVIAATERRLADLVAAQRFEQATLVRDRLRAFLRTAAATQARDTLIAVRELVAVRPHPGGAANWELLVVRHGRLAATGYSVPGGQPREDLARLVAGAEHVAGEAAERAATAAETDLILGWLASPGVRLVELAGTWTSPARGAGAQQRWLTLSTGGELSGR